MHPYISGVKLQFTDRPLGAINKNDFINIFLLGYSKRIYSVCMSLCIINITSYYYYYYYILLNGWAILNKSLHDHHHTLIINIYVFKKKKIYCFTCCPYVTMVTNICIHDEFCSKN